MKPMQSIFSSTIKKLTGHSPRYLFEALVSPMNGAGTPAYLGTFAEKKVVVLAPHPDDEAIGCGGTLLKHLAAGSQIILIYLTDGRRGNGSLSQMSAKERAAVQHQLISIRRQEAQTCADELKAIACFLDGEDGVLSPQPALIKQLIDLLTHHEPDLLYLPFAWDSHEDHWQSNKIACTAISQLPKHLTADLIIRAYEVWSPLPANRVVDISQEFAGKTRLIAHYVSQLADTDYLKLIGGLNTYRALALPERRGYAEAFFECGSANYLKIVNRMEYS